MVWSVFYKWCYDRYSINDVMIGILYINDGMIGIFIKINCYYPLYKPNQLEIIKYDL